MKLTLLTGLIAVNSYAADPSHSVFQMNTPDGRCTAFAISLFRYGTAAHCVLDESGIKGVYIASATLISRNGLSITAKPQYVDEKHDVAILLSSSPLRGIAPLRLARKEPVYGDKVTLVGNVFGTGWVREDGIVKSVQTNNIMSDVKGNPGFSGAPLFNDKWEVVGVLSYGIMHGPVREYTVARKIKWLRDR